MKTEEAERLVGRSVSWIKGVDVSIKKWEELVESKEKRKDGREWAGLCGLCWVSWNRLSRQYNDKFNDCSTIFFDGKCPLSEDGFHCCKEFKRFEEKQTIKNAQRMLNRLKKLRKQLIREGYR